MTAASLRKGRAAPRTVEEAMTAMEAEESAGSPADVPAGQPEAADGREGAVDAGGLPEWAAAAMPPDLKIPPGREVQVLMFRAGWTVQKQKGDRVVVLWELSDSEEKLALKRTRGEGTRALAELAKQTIRAIDGHRADWARPGPGNVERFWEDIGPKCRMLVQNNYGKTHALSAEETSDFFENCTVFRTAEAG